MKILLAASEVAPIIKMGGLGDVIGSLPKALEKKDVECDVIVPYFPFAKLDDKDLTKKLELEVPYGGASYTVEVFLTSLPDSNVKVFLLKNDMYFHSHSPTWKISNEEELELFSFFDRAVVEYIKSSYNTYDVVHCHDWHTGLITHLLADELGHQRPATIFTIHNLLYQGIGSPMVVRNVGIVPGEHPLIDWDVADGNINMIQQGISSADYISTVSPTYKDEIQTQEFGGGLEDILQVRAARLTGILNGIDYKALKRDYDINTYSEVKTREKLALQKKLGLKESSNIPMFSFVGRLDPHQKGIDLIYNVIPNIVKEGGQFVLLGSGDGEWESKLLAKAKDLRDSGALSVNIAFDPVLSQNIYAASDFLLVPSRYEPCGLIQMIAMWYGTLPIVRATGGLKDSVKEGLNGYLFENYDSSELINAVTKALSDYKGQRTSKLILNAMISDFSWDVSATEYKNLYTKVIQLRKEAF